MRNAGETNFGAEGISYKASPFITTISGKRTVFWRNSEKQMHRRSNPFNGETLRFI